MSLTRAQILSEIAANLPDNNSELITPAIHRTTLGDVSGALWIYSNDAYIVVPTTNDPVANGDALWDALGAAYSLTPNGSDLSETNRAVVLVPPGFYDLGIRNLFMDAFVDIVGITGDPRHVLITSSAGGLNSGSVVQISSSVRLKGLWVRNTAAGRTNTNATDPAALCWVSGLTGMVYENCIFDDNGTSWSMRLATNCAGTFINVACGERAFGFNADLSGSCKGCTAGNYSFGYGGILSASIQDCTGEDLCFGANGTIVSRSFNSYGGPGSWNGNINDVAVIEQCRSRKNAFGSGFSVAGRLINCSMPTIPQEGSPWAPSGFSGLVSGMRFEQLADNLNAVTIPDGATGEFEFCTFKKTGTGIPMGIAAAGAATIKFSYCKFNTTTGVESGITNSLGATLAIAFNIGDADV